MDTEREIYRLAARTMALEVILKNLLRDLAQTEPYWRVRLSSALNNASDQLEGATIKLGKSAHLNIWQKLFALAKSSGPW